MKKVYGNFVFQKIVITFAVQFRGNNIAEWSSGSSLGS